MQPVAPTLAEYSGSQGQNQETAEIEIKSQNRLAVAAAPGVRFKESVNLRQSLHKRNMNGRFRLPGASRLPGDEAICGCGSRGLTRGRGSQKPIRKLATGY